MVYFVGNNIYIHEGDDASFKVVYQNSRKKICNFDPKSILTMHIKDRDNYHILSTKIASTVMIENDECSVFTFTSQELRQGYYLYDLIVESSVGSRHTVISDASLNILENNNHKSDMSPEEEFFPHRVESVDSNILYVSSTPLVCKLDYIQVDGTEVETGSLVLFDTVSPTNPPTPDEDPSEDTLIEF